MDFVMDGPSTGRGLRMFTMVDSYTRECLSIEVDSCLSSRSVSGSSFLCPTNLASR